MAISQRLELRQGQSLMMTTQLQQAIKLLQLNNIELTDFLQEELERNPLLEREETTQEGDSQTTAEKTHENEDSLDHVNSGELSSENQSPLDTEYENSWESGNKQEDRPIPTQSTTNTETDDYFFSLENKLTQPTNLRDHVKAQISIDINDPAERLVAFALADMLEDTGYIEWQVNELCYNLNCTENFLEEVLFKVQRCDPPGVFARNLKECLALQLKERNRYDPAMQAMVEHLEMLASKDIQGLLRVCEVDQNDLADMIDEIRSLNPKPGDIFEHELIQSITPDLFMKAHPEGGWIIEMNYDHLPKIMINHDYYSRITTKSMSKADKQYITELHNSASWIIKAVNQRAQTLLRVATEIVKRQEKFFTHGVQYLRPMVMQDISLALEIHESTVSRATINKYIATPRGLFELKYFFTASISGLDGESVFSATYVRDKVKDLIETEDPANPLSDEDIVGILNKEGMNIARRTVAKYRDQLNLPKSYQRKKNHAHKLQETFDPFR